MAAEGGSILHRNLTEDEEAIAYRLARAGLLEVGGAGVVLRRRGWIAVGKKPPAGAPLWIIALVLGLLLLLFGESMNWWNVIPYDASREASRGDWNMPR